MVTLRLKYIHILGIVYAAVYRRWAGIAQSVQRLATGWAVRRSSPGGGEIFALVQTGRVAHPASCTMGSGSLSRRQSGRGEALTSHPHPVPRLKKEQSYTSTPHLDFQGMF
jgi:hypothetical protein